MKKSLNFIIPVMLLMASTVYSQPHQFQRTNPNLLKNSQLSGKSGWHFLGGSHYDAAISMSQDSGSGRLTKANQVIASSFIKVTPGVEYTLSAFVRTDVKPFSGVSLFGSLKSRSGKKRNIAGSRITNSQAGV